MKWVPEPTSLRQSCVPLASKAEEGVDAFAVGDAARFPFSGKPKALSPFCNFQSPAFRV